MIIENDEKLDFQDVLIRPKRSALESRSQVDLIRMFKPKYGNEFSCIPIIAANMATGTFDMLKAFSKEKMMVAIAKYHNQEWIDHIYDEDLLTYGIYTIGMSDEELKGLVAFGTSLRTEWIMHPKLKICIDIANGYTQKFASFVSKVREVCPSNLIVVGNVATPEMVQELILAGADYVKVGLGPGKMCTTRFKTGVGYPQISAAIECSDAAHGLGGGIVLDGGMRNPGDIAKAFCANSDMVMIGGIFAGTDESDGEIITRYYKTNEYTDANCDKFIIQEKKFKLFYGMSSEYSQEKHFGGKKEYRTSEGRVEEVPYVGTVQNIVNDILGGLRSTCTYIGAKTIKDMGKCATLIKVSRIHDRTF
jgi:GMP reductase